MSDRTAEPAGSTRGNAQIPMTGSVAAADGDAASLAPAGRAPGGGAAFSLTSTQADLGIPGAGAGLRGTTGGLGGAAWSQGAGNTITGTIPLDEPAPEKTSERQTSPAPSPAPSSEPFRLVFPQDIEENQQGATVSALGGELRVDTATSGLQFLLSVAVLADGSFVITWTAGVDGNGASVMAQRFAAEVGRLGEVLALAGDDAGQSIFSIIAGLDDGGFVITRTRGLIFGDDDDDGGIGGSGQRYAADGMAADEVFTVNQAGHQHASFRSVAALADGGLVVAWMTEDGDCAGIAGQRFDAAGGLAGEAFVVNAKSVGARAFPAGAGLPGGGFVVTWEGNGEGDGFGVFSRVVGVANHTLVGPSGDDLARRRTTLSSAWPATTCSGVGRAPTPSGSVASVAPSPSRILRPRTATCPSCT